MAITHTAILEKLADLAVAGTFRAGIALAIVWAVYMVPARGIDGAALLRHATALIAVARWGLPLFFLAGLRECFRRVGIAGVASGAARRVWHPGMNGVRS